MEHTGRGFDVRPGIYKRVFVSPPPLAGGRPCHLANGLGLATISAQVVVLMTLKLEPILMIPEIGGTQPSLINALSEVPPLAYFVHNTYLDPSVHPSPPVPDVLPDVFL